MVSFFFVYTLVSRKKNEERKWTQLNITWEIVEIGLFISMDFINFDKALELEWNETEWIAASKLDEENRSLNLYFELQITLDSGETRKN